MSCRSKLSNVTVLKEVQLLPRLHKIILPYLLLLPISYYTKLTKSCKASPLRRAIRCKNGVIIRHRSAFLVFLRFFFGAFLRLSLRSCSSLKIEVGIIDRY